MNLLQRAYIKIKNDEGSNVYGLDINPRFSGDDSPYVYNFTQQSFDEAERMIDEKTRLIQIDDIEELNFIYEHIEECWNYINNLYNHKTPYIVLVQIRPNNDYMSFKQVATIEDIVRYKISNCEKCVLLDEYIPHVNEDNYGRTEVVFMCPHRELFSDYNDSVYRIMLWLNRGETVKDRLSEIREVIDKHNL